MTTKRRIIKIDEDKCDGCGLCATACHENAIHIVDGKAKLMSDSYCDGLGDCLGECPRGAISFEEREAAAYDAAAVAARIAQRDGEPPIGDDPRDSSRSPHDGCPGSVARTLGGNGAPHVCPGTMARRITEQLSAAKVKTTEDGGGDASRPSHLINWPVQLALVPENAPYLAGAHLVISADCVPFAHADFHRDFLSNGAVCLIGCPKLDDVAFYQSKMLRLLSAAHPASVTVLSMEVPCCNGLPRLIERAIEESRVSVDYRWVKIALTGQIISNEQTKYRFA